MAERRMFAKTIIDSDAFLDMPLSSQALYFHLSMRADDDGFINNPKKIQRMIGCGDDDLKMLIAKRFIIPFESGIVVIKHWKIHNFIRNDRYKETVYQKEKALLSEKENKAYTLNGIPTVYQTDTNGIPKDIPKVDEMETQYRLGKERDSLEIEIEEEKESAPQAVAPPARPAKSTIDYDSFKNTYNEICTNLSKVKLLSDKRKTAIRNFLKQLTFEDFKKACEIANTLDFTTGKNNRGWKADFDFLITVDKALGVLEGKYKDKEPKRTEPPKERSYDIDEFFDLACKRGAGTPKTAGNDESIRERAEALKQKLS